MNEKKKSLLTTVPAARELRKVPGFDPLKYLRTISRNGEKVLKLDLCYKKVWFRLDELFAFLRKNGTEEIIEAEDMDKYSNDMVSKGASKVCQLAVKHGMTCRRLVWNPNYKGIDDWQLALHRKNEIQNPFQASFLFQRLALSSAFCCHQSEHFLLVVQNLLHSQPFGFSILRKTVPQGLHVSNLVCHVFGPKMIAVDLPVAKEIITVAAHPIQQHIPESVIPTLFLDILFILVSVDENKFEMMMLANDAGLGDSELSDFQAALDSATASMSMCGWIRWKRTFPGFGKSF